MAKIRNAMTPDIRRLNCFDAKLMGMTAASFIREGRRKFSAAQQKGKGNK